MPSWLTNLRFPSFGWWDLLDLAIVSLILYEVLKAIRGTRAVQMAIGSAVFVIVFYLSQWGQLETVNWLVRNVASYVVFAMIVLFQADIRRALAHLGRGPFFRYFLGTESADEAIEELVVAATLLGSHRIGAIIVIERQIGLRNYIEGGIPLDAILTNDQLVSIFQLDSPLHDGAVIVQHDRVAAAGCFLPLTVAPELSRTLGTRHRAAIGLTEENDAVAIVVSEETGIISLALDGRIERELSGDQLRTRLHQLLRSQRRDEKVRKVRVGVQAPWLNK
jgi:diadenylate cyclase